MSGAKSQTSSLVGKFFHGFDADGYVETQGYIRAQIDATHYCVEFLDWIIGARSDEIIVDLSAMVSPSLYGRPVMVLYDTVKEMTDTYENRLRYRVRPLDQVTAPATRQ